MPVFGCSTVTNTRPPPYLAAFSTRLPSISSRSCRSTRTSRLLVAGEVDGDVLVEPVDRALDRFEAVPDRGAGLGRGAAADGAGAGEMVVDLAAHRRRLAADGVGEVGAVRGGGVGDHGQRRLQRMGEVAGVAPRLLGLHLVMGEQVVDLVGQRLDLAREIARRCAVCVPERIGDHLAPHPAQRPQAVERLQRGEDEQAEAEHGEAARSGSRRSSLICSSIVSRDWATWKRQRTWLPGRTDVALDDAQRLAVEFVAVVGVQLDVVVAAGRRAGGGPTASATGRCPAPSPLIWK